MSSDSSVNSSQPLILRADSFDFYLSEYLEEEGIELFRKKINARRYTVNETNVSYRIINHWHQKKILPEGSSGTGEWHRFSLIEMTWMKIVKVMRDFGLSLEKIALIREQVMKWHKKTDDYPLYEYYFFEAWIGRSDPYIAILSTGGADIGSILEIERGKLCQESYNVLLISLRNILQRIGVTPQEVKERKAYSLTEDQISLLSEIRLGGADEVKAKVNQDGRITEIESTVVISDPDAPHKMKERAKQEGIFGEIITKYENGIPQLTRSTKKKRL